MVSLSYNPQNYPDFVIFTQVKINYLRKRFRRLAKETIYNLFKMIITN